jgi:hypothetical protein
MRQQIADLETAAKLMHEFSSEKQRDFERQH